MGKVIVVVLATLFATGLLYHFVPATAEPIATWSRGVSWILVAFAVFFIGAWRLVSKA